MIEVKIDIVSDEDESKRVTMDTICITKTCDGRYHVYGDDRSNVCSIEKLWDVADELDLVRRAITSLIKSGNYCHINIIPDGVEV